MLREPIMKTIIAFIPCLLVAGCHSLNPDAKTDCATDNDCLNGYTCANTSCVRVETVDLAPAKISCAKMATCALSCGNEAQCQTDCYNRGTAHGQMLSLAVVSCVTATCVASAGGDGRCTSYPGDVSTTCQTCVNNSGLGWSPAYPCTPSSDPACNDCGTEVQNCLADQ